MWVVYALASAFFAGIMSVLAKIGVRDVDSSLATALRMIAVAAFAWFIAITGGLSGAFADITLYNYIFLILSGLATGASWLCYFHAIKIGDVNKVAPVDKSSVVLTILLSFIILDENISAVKIIAMGLIGIGTYMMASGGKTARDNPKNRKWLIYAAASAVFASLTSILAKIGFGGINSNLGTAIRVAVVFVMAWLVVFVRGKHRGIKKIDVKSWVFIMLSGFATGASWLFYFRALQEGPVSAVVPIDKLSIVLTVSFGVLFLREKMTKKSLSGLLVIVAGTLFMLK